MNQKIKAFLYYVAVADPDVLLRCPKNEVYLFEVKAFLILATSLAACFSGSYAMFTVFHDWGPSIPIGIIWGFMIFNLDRLLISSIYAQYNANIETRFFKNFLIPILLRFPLAVIIGIAISTPIELSLFEEDIIRRLKYEKEQKGILLLDSVNWEIKNFISEKNVIIQKNRNRRELEIDKLNLEKMKNENKRDSLNKVLIAIDEKSPIDSLGRRIAQGVSFWDLRKELKRIEKLVSNGEQKISNRKEEIYLKYDSLLRKSIELIEIKENQKITLLKNNLVEFKQSSINKSFLERYKALKRIANDDEDAAWLVFFVKLIIVLIEVLPLLAKLFSNKGQYEREMEMFRLLEEKKLDFFQ